MTTVASIRSSSLSHLVTCGFLALAGTSSAHAAGPVSIDLAAMDFARMRCALDGSDVYIQWTGKVFGQVEGERQKHLFDILGVNIGRCLRASDGGWDLVTRELQLYRDPASGETLQTWTNPWTSEVVPVMHVANDPVYHPIAQKTYIAQKAGDRIVFSEDVPLTYPNPLAGNPDFEPYGNQPLYQAIEMFRFYAPAESFLIRQPEGSSTQSPGQMARIDNVTLSWTRVSAWLPWMKMGKRPGMLVSSAGGVKLRSYEALDAALRDEIDKRLPRYRLAPSCVPAARNVTSWTAFRDNFADYLAKERFPLPSSRLDDVCRVNPHG